MTNAAETTLNSRDVALRVASRYLAPRWKGVAVSLLCAAIAAGLTGLLLDILQPAIDSLNAKSGARFPLPPVLQMLAADLHLPSAMAAFIIIPATIAVLAMGKGLAQLIQATLVNRIGNGIVGDVQLELFGKLIRADLARLRATHTGGFVSSVLYDTGLIREAATTGVINFTQQALTLAAAGVVMAVKDWKLGLFVVLAAPIIALFLRRFLRRATSAASGAMQATGALSTAIMEGLDGVRVVKMENRETYEEGRVAAAIAERQGHIISGDNARASAAPVSETLMTFVIAAVLAYEGWQASTGHSSVGAVVAFFMALLAASQALRQVSNLTTIISQGVVAGRRLFAALDVEPEVGDAAGAADLIPGEAHIRLSGVSFHYRDDAPVLDSVDLEARRGEIVALVGPSGAGKTTVLNLIPRFYDITAGDLTIDGQDVRHVTLASLRRQIALVTQEPFLFDDTIAANIAYAKAGASQAEIETAARAAAAHDFILGLPNGYGTLVGEAGARLSGGQRQRIAIARAFLKNAPILLLDEATSALDTESEAQVQAALTRLMAGRTTLIIAHRLSTVRGADRIYVLDQGRVVEVGDHDSLVALGGLYARLAGAQNLDQTMEAGA